MTIQSEPTAKHDAPRRAKRPSRLATSIVRDLIDEIVSGQLQPGDVVSSESALAEEFQVSRIVIREALKTLEERGLLVVRQGVGTTVDARSNWNLLDSEVLAAAIRYDATDRTLENIVAVRADLEAQMAETAAIHADAAHWAAARPIIERMKAATRDPSLFSELDHEFHAHVMAAGDNEIAAAVITRIHSHALNSAAYPQNAPRDRLEKSAQEHERILDLLTHGDGAGAKAAMYSHIIDSWKRRRR